MLPIDQTELQTFPFGNDPDDIYYMLINTRVNPVGIDIMKLSKADPRTFDATLNEMGCILLLSGDEVEELERRGDVDSSNLHETLYELAVKEGVIR